MRHKLRRSLVAAIATVASMAVLAPAAGASIGTPSVALSPSSATAASTANQGVNIGFSPSSGDSVKNLTLQLPPGLIANASIDGGACLKSATPLAACQVGSGTVTPSGLSFVPHRVGKKLRVKGVSARGAKIKSLSLSHGHLVIALRKPSAAVTVTLGSLSLKESGALRAKAKRNRVKSLKLTVIVDNAKHKNKTLHLKVKVAHL